MISSYTVGISMSGILTELTVVGAAVGVTA